jgi:CheY-like chemotaxis protein
LLAFAKQQPLAPRTFDLNKLITDSVAMLRRVLTESMTIRTELSLGLWPVEADPTQVETALTSLAINSRDAMPEGGTITISTGNRHVAPAAPGLETEIAPGDYAFLSITDTGNGIPPEDLKHVFEPFFTTKAPGTGTGMGLSMVYGFAKQSKGHLTVDSVVGSGTIVTLYLPRSKYVEAVAEKPEDQPARGNGRILVVEDNPHVQDVVVRQLADLGYDVKAVDDAIAALNALRHFADIDLLFSDVVLPGGITGAALVREARKVRPGLRALLTSGLSNPADGAEAPEEGVAFIGKPYRRNDLARKVQEVLGDAADAA